MLTLSYAVMLTRESTNSRPRTTDHCRAWELVSTTSRRNSTSKLNNTNTAASGKPLFCKNWTNTAIPPQGVTAHSVRRKNHFLFPQQRCNFCWHCFVRPQFFDSSSINLTKKSLFAVGTALGWGQADSFMDQEMNL